MERSKPMSGESLRVMTLRAVVERDRGLEWRQFIEALPAVIECDPRFGLEAAAVVGLRAAAHAAARARSRQRVREKEKVHRRLGGRRDRRVLEGM